MFTTDEVQHIAALARIRFSEKDLEAFQKEFEVILNFVGKLHEVDTKSTEPTAQVTGLTNALRKDGEETNNRQLTTNDLLLSQAPQREGNYVKVKAVFEP